MTLFRNVALFNSISPLLTWNPLRLFPASHHSDRHESLRDLLFCACNVRRCCCIFSVKDPYSKYITTVYIDLLISPRVSLITHHHRSPLFSPLDVLTILCSITTFYTFFYSSLLWIFSSWLSFDVGCSPIFLYVHYISCVRVAGYMQCGAAAVHRQYTWHCIYSWILLYYIGYWIRNSSGESVPRNGGKFGQPPFVVFK